jgi:hypothetical protein
MVGESKSSKENGTSGRYVRDAERDLPPHRAKQVRDVNSEDFTTIEHPKLGTFVTTRKVRHVAERKIRQVADIEEDDEAFPEHPLFPVPDDEPSFEVSFIQVTRWENGRQVWGPCLSASDLPHELAVQEMFGGGQYSLVARRAQKNDKTKPSGITKTRKITLPGRPKPMSVDPTPEEEAAYDPTKRPPPIAAQASGSPFAGGVENIFLAMMSMQQQAAERQAAEARETARREAESSKNFMTMFLGMMQNSKADTAQMMSMMMQVTSQNQAAMMQLMPAMMAARGGGPEEMAKLAEVFKAFGFTPSGGGGGAVAKPSGDDSSSLGAIVSNAADVIQGLVALKGGVMPEGAAVVQPPPALAPAAPGSAQEMLERLKRGG